MQEHIDARALADAIERELHDFGIEQCDDDVRRRPYRRCIAAERFDLAQHRIADTAYDLHRRVGLRPEPAVREHVAVRRRATEIGGALDQCNRRTRLRGGDGSGHSGRTAARNDDVVAAQRVISWG
jgi:hypothetical protein